MCKIEKLVIKLLESSQFHYERELEKGPILVNRPWKTIRKLTRIHVGFPTQLVAQYDYQKAVQKKNKQKNRYQLFVRGLF